MFGSKKKKKKSLLFTTQALALKQAALALDPEGEDGRSAGQELHACVDQASVKRDLL